MSFHTLRGNDLIRRCAAGFDGVALDLYRYQYEKNDLYHAYHQALKIDPASISSIADIPFLPISFFKSHRVRSFESEAALVFDSSGTTGMQVSRHYIADPVLYDEVALAGFEQFYGPAEEWIILALLPSYLERSSSSLVHMARMLMERGGHPESGFYLNEWQHLQQKLLALQGSGKKVLLLGVTFALMDFAAAYPMDLSGVTIMETGGMKGRAEERTREEVHDFLKQQWQIRSIHSEYGMTELLSQAYATSGGLFRPITTMRALVRDIEDPLETKERGSGVLNIVDLANVHSCSFIATEDVGTVYADGSFSVSGRIDFAALRGCSLMAV